MTVLEDVAKLIEALDKSDNKAWFVIYANASAMKDYGLEMAKGNTTYALDALKRDTAQWILSCASRCIEARIMIWK